MSKRSYERRIRAKREAQRAERKRVERRHKFRVWSSVAAALALAALLLIVFLGGNDKKEPSASSSTSPTPSASGSPIAGCTVPTPEPKPNGKTFNKAPAMTINKATLYVATFQTSCGNVVMQMDPKQSPASVNNFVFLAKQGFYDNTKVGRVQNEAGFAIVQAGTQTGTISGGVDYSYAGETPPPSTVYSRGVVAMANSGGPSSNGSQFFFVVRDWKDLPKNYTVFGRVSDAASLSALDRMISARGPEVQPGGNLGISPNPPIFILKVTIAEKNP